MPFAVYAAIYGVLAVLLLYAVVTRWLRPVALEDPVQIEPQRAAQVEQRIDPNTADWPDLARLPGVGEAIAQRIVEYREQHGRAGPSGAKPLVFRTADDLDDIPGIGPKTVERIRPYLRFPGDTER